MIKMLKTHPEWEIGYNFFNMTTGHFCRSNGDESCEYVSRLEHIASRAELFKGE